MKKKSDLLITGFLFMIFSLVICQISSAYEKDIKNISSVLAESISRTGKKTIAVVDFTELKGGGKGLVLRNVPLTR